MSHLIGDLLHNIISYANVFHVRSFSHKWKNDYVKYHKLPLQYTTMDNSACHSHQSDNIIICINRK
jgi:hypothetical protein